MTVGTTAQAPMIVDHVARVIRELVPADRVLRYLDLGAGWGDLIQRLRSSHPLIESSGVDFNPSHFALKDVPVLQADFNLGRLPFEDASFDLVTCTEVVEHLENFRHAIREAARVTRAGGWFIGSTPNVLSLKARWVYLTSGFFTYFDPLPLKDHPTLYPGQRHITPVPFFYFGHALLDAGFEEITPRADKAQRSSTFAAWILGGALRLLAARAHHRRIRHSGTLPPALEKLARANNSWPVLTGRTLIVTALRSAANGTHAQSTTRAD